MGIPVDGTSSEMVRQLKSKGFTKLTNVKGTDVLAGRFNGVDVHVYISTENGKVSRIMVCDQNDVNETDIKIRFNNLCKQFTNNDKYLSLDDYTIPEDEDISYEMGVKKKRYEAIFYQKPEEEALDEIKTSMVDNIINKYGKDELSAPSEETQKDIISTSIETYMNNLKMKPVWFKISENYGEYSITMFYDNEYNRPNGEDL